jgi:hypothetical protein
MRRLIRGLFAFEALITLGTGVMGMLNPTAFAAQFVVEPPTGAGLDFVRWLMATYFVIATLELGLLWRGTREAWVLALVPILLGDALHVLGHATMLSHGGLVGMPTWASFGFTAVFATARILVLRKPELVVS